MIIVSEINECFSSPCDNGGKCSDRLNGFRCSCLAGYTGDTCNTGNKICSAATFPT